MYRFLIIAFLVSISSCAQEKRESVEEQEIKLENEFHLDMDLLQADSAQINPSDTILQVTKFTNKILFEDSLKALFEEIKVDSVKLKYEVFRYAMIGYYSMLQDGKLDATREIISIIDYTLPSTAKRFYTIDLKNKQYIFNTLVSHGRNTGGNTSTKFSNKPQSFQTSLGFYITGNTYIGGKGFSMRLHGHESGYNDNAFKRAIVMHNAPYVSQEWIEKYGRIGRSLGCPVLSKKIAKNVINTIKDKTLLFAYYNDVNYLTASKFLDLHQLIETMNLDAEE